MEFTSKARRPFEFVDTYRCYYWSIVYQIFYMGIKFCDIQYLDWIVRYIVLRKATRFVSVWSIISIFSSSVEKKKKIYFILLEINATSCVITEWPPFPHKLLWALRRFWKKKTCLCFHHHPHLPHHPRHHHHLTIRLSHLHQECLWSKNSRNEKEIIKYNNIIVEV